MNALSDRALIRTGAAGAILAGICCVTAVLAVPLPVVGLGAWLARADLLLFALLAASLGLVAWGLYLRSTKAGCCDAETQNENEKP